MRQLIYVFSIFIAVGCASKPEEYASERNFYFTVETESTSNSVLAVKRYLENVIPKHKYSITNSSGSNWPYYQAFELDERVPSNTIVPPHTFVHRMVPFKEELKIEEDEFLVQVVIFEKPDTIPNYSVTIFRRKENEFKLSASSGLHFIQPSEYETQNQLAEAILKNCLRYSFK